MQSVRLPGPIRLSILALALAGVAACASTPPLTVILPALQCGPMIPPSYRKPVQSAPLPPPDMTVGDVLVFGDAQTAALDQANGKTADVIAAVDECDKRNAALLKEWQLTKRPTFR